MKQLDITTPITIARYEELSTIEQKLVDEARNATLRAYAPYSKFSVGAVILLSNGEIITGANQENVAYPSGTCAERTACFYAHAQYPDARFQTIAIAARGTDGNELPQPISPCGSCRQSLLEYEMLAKGNVKVMLIGADEIYILPSVKSLLPLAFSEF
ncbi:MAG: cytidine deaminase [Muribaculaceae bacterium]|nr:cytidine deaminase [Muribaculaceae bacterium]